MDVDYSIEIGDFSVWVIEFKGIVAGGVIMMFEDNHASIANIAVHSNYDGQGLGRALMDFSEAIAKQKQLTELRLATHRLLIENILLYEYLGWTEYDRDEIRVYMRKPI